MTMLMLKANVVMVMVVMVNEGEDAQHEEDITTSIQLITTVIIYIRALYFERKKMYP